jgi:hypothetical protein
MSGFTQVPNYDFLKGLELTRIEVNPGNVVFKFLENREIDVWGKFSHTHAADRQASVYQVDGTDKQFTVHALLGHRIADAQIVSDDLLKLVFDNGDTLALFRRNDGYESMTIWDPEGVLVIY